MPLVLDIDAYPYDISAVLSHVMPGDIETPIGFVSRNFTNAEKQYREVDKELLAIIFHMEILFSLFVW